MEPSSLSPANGSMSPTPESCYYEPPPMTDVRFWLVTVFGSAVSAISIVNNILLFYLFSSKKHHRTNHNMYMMLLAFFDVFVSTAYICLMSVNVLSDYLQSPMLVKIWFFYMVPMITISHIAMTSSSFLIVAATFERYCLTLNTRTLPFVQKNRKLIAALSIFLGVISKGSMCIEFELYEMPECEGLMTATQMGYRAFVFDTPYHILWRFWYRNFVTVFAPFFILSYLNIRIVKALTVHTKMTVCQLAGNAILEQAKRKANARAATRTLVLVVCCYLISNIINVLLTIFEHLDKETLLTKFLDVYAISVDLVSLLTTLACAFRLPIYLTCQPALRAEVKEIIKNTFCRNKSKMVEDNEFLVNCGMSRTAECSQESKETTVSYHRPPIQLSQTPKIKRKISMDQARYSLTISPDELKLCLNSPYETLL